MKRDYSICHYGVVFLGFIMYSYVNAINKSLIKDAYDKDYQEAKQAI